MNTLFQDGAYKYTQDDDAYYIKVWKFKSSNWKHAYTVGTDYQGLLKCSCPGFKYHSGQCKHITKMVEYMKENDTCLNEIPDKDRINKFNVHNNIEALINWIYEYKRRTDLEAAKKLVRKLRKERPEPPWINRTLSLDTYEAYSDKLDSMLAKIESDYASRVV